MSETTFNGAKSDISCGRLVNSVRLVLETNTLTRIYVKDVYAFVQKCEYICVAVIANKYRKNYRKRKIKTSTRLCVYYPVILDR